MRRRIGHGPHQETRIMTQRTGKLVIYGQKLLNFTVWLLLLLICCSCTDQDISYDSQGNLLEKITETFVPPETPVILISIDTLRADHLSCYGYLKKTSPYIDAFAQDAVIFENAFVQSPWTTPSHISMLCSLYPSVHGVVNYPNPDALDPKATTLAEILLKQNYQTAAFTEGGYTKPHFGLGQGFQRYPLFEGEETSNFENLKIRSRLKENMQRTLSWLEETSAPFFLFFHTFEPHYPYDPPETFLKEYTDFFSREARMEKLKAIIAKGESEKKLSAEEWSFFMIASYQGLYDWQEVEDPSWWQSASNFFFNVHWKQNPSFRRNFVQGLLDLYDGAINYTDSQIERMLDALKQRNLYDESLIIITSDHGEGFMEHGEIEHGHTHYEEILHVPMIVKLPGSRFKGRRISSTVLSIDILPTVLDIIGLPPLKKAQGKSFYPLMSETPDTNNRTAYAEGTSLPDDPLGLKSIRDESRRLIVHSEQDRFELYDLKNDPDEKINLASENLSKNNDLLNMLIKTNEKNQKLKKRYKVQKITLSQEDIEELKALGYFQ